MALKIYDTIKPQGNYPAVNAEDVQMPDGKRLAYLDVTPPVVAGSDVLDPEKYYEFGVVSELSITLAEKDDGKAHEYTFEFTPGENFQGLTINPNPTWVQPPQYVTGKRCIVCIFRGMAVMGSA